jgi:hypothetical protein
VFVVLVAYDLLRALFNDVCIVCRFEISGILSVARRCCGMRYVCVCYFHSG